jgi:hypothetical protein
VESGDTRRIGAVLRTVLHWRRQRPKSRHTREIGRCETFARGRAGATHVCSSKSREQLSRLTWDRPGRPYMVAKTLQLNTTLQRDYLERLSVPRATFNRVVTRAGSPCAPPRHRPRASPPPAPGLRSFRASQLQSSEAATLRARASASAVARRSAGSSRLRCLLDGICDGRRFACLGARGVAVDCRNQAEWQCPPSA